MMQLASFCIGILKSPIMLKNIGCLFDRDLTYRYLLSCCLVKCRVSRSEKLEIYKFRWCLQSVYLIWAGRIGETTRIGQRFNSGGLAPLSYAVGVNVPIVRGKTFYGDSVGQETHLLTRKLESKSKKRCVPFPVSGRRFFSCFWHIAHKQKKSRTRLLSLEIFALWLSSGKIRMVRGERISLRGSC